MDRFSGKLYYLSINTEDANEYAKLKERLEQLNKEENTAGNYIFYLSTPPSLYLLIPKFHAKQGLNRENGNFRRIIIKKPFGTDLQSATELNVSIRKDYDEEQIYRIDHYLGKETVQNMPVTRFANGIYEPLWKRETESLSSIASDV